MGNTVLKPNEEQELGEENLDAKRIQKNIYY